MSKMMNHEKRRRRAKQVAPIAQRERENLAPLFQPRSDILDSRGRPISLAPVSILKRRPPA